MLKKIKYLLLSSLVLGLMACQSVAQYNAHRQTSIDPEALKKDVDFVQKKLQNLHPQLYNYIAKEDLDQGFDSLKLSLNQGLTPNQFYQHLAPIVGRVRQGHLRLNPLAPRYLPNDQKKYVQYLNFLRKFKFQQLEHSIYITESKDSLCQIPAGAQLLSLNQSNTKQDLQRLKRHIIADGFNTTFAKNGLTTHYFNHFFVDYPLEDSLKIKYLYQEKEHTLALLINQKKQEKPKPNASAVARDDSMDDIWDYNPSHNTYRRYFKYLRPNHEVAYLKISEFSGRNTKKFCQFLFDDLQKKACKTLIIDLRNNPGGIEKDIQTLYAYLSPKPYQIIKNYQLASATSVYHSNYIGRFDGFLGKAWATITYPIALLSHCLSVKKENGNYYHQYPFYKAIKENSPLAFDQKIYVLCNSGTFSAAGILAAQLKYDGLATLVGEETGAANDGTVAGFFSTEILPYSRLRLPIGLIAYEPNLMPDAKKAGIMPHHHISPSLLDLINKKDVALDWVLAQCPDNTIQKTLD